MEWPDLLLSCTQSSLGGLSDRKSVASLVSWYLRTYQGSIETPRLDTTMLSFLEIVTARAKTLSANHATTSQCVVSFLQDLSSEADRVSQEFAHFVSPLYP